MKGLLPLARIALSGGVLVQACGVLIRLVLTVALARILDARGLGAYTLCLAIAMIPQLPARIGLPAFLSYIVPKLEAGQDYATARGVLYLSTSAAILTFLAFCLVLCAIQLCTGLITGPMTFGILILGGFTVLLDALCGILAAVVVAFGSYVRGLAYPNILQPLLFITALVTLAGANKITLLEVLVIHASSSVLILAVLVANLSFETRARWLTTKPAYPVKWLVNEAYPIVIAESVNEGAANVVSILVGSLLTLRELGLFRVIQTLTGAVSFIYTSLFQLIRPQVARLWHDGQIDGLANLLRDSARTAFVLSIGPMIILVLFARTMLFYGFGPMFVEAYQPLLVVAAGCTIAASVGYGMPLLTMTQYSKVAMWVTGATGILRVVLVAIFSLAWGIDGATLALGLMIAGSNIIVAVLAFRLTGLDASMVGMRRSPCGNALLLDKQSNIENV